MVCTSWEVWVKKKKDKPGIGSQEALTFNSNSAADLEALFHPFGA
jgi:hypothetical protein